MTEAPRDCTTTLAEKVRGISLISPLPSEELQKADLRFPHLNLSHHSSSGSGCITHEPLADGLLGKVKFVPWNGFDQIVDETLHNLDLIPDEYHIEAACYFDICRKQANRIYGPPVSLNPLGKVSKIKPSPAEPSCYAATLMFKGEDPRKSFDVSSSLSMEKDIFEGIRELLRGIYIDDYEFEFPQGQFSLIGERRTPKSRKPIPDRSLCTVSMNRMVAPPVCAFEMKAPTVSFGSVVLDVVRTSLEPCSDDDETSDSDSEDYDWVARRLCGGKRCEHEVSAYGLCKYFNAMFESAENSFNGSRFVSQQKRMMIAQTIVQALTTQTGCGFLFTYETGIAFELQRLNQKGQIVIRTSPMFCYGNRKGVGAAILSLSSYAVRKLSEDKGSLNRMSKFVRVVTDTAQSCESRGERPDRNNSVGDDGDSDKDTGKTQSCGMHESCVVPHFQECGKAKTADLTMTDTERTANCVDSLAHISEISEASADLKQDEEPVQEGRQESLVDRLYQLRGNLIGKGWSAMVFQVEWEGKSVTLKVWNGEYEEGQLELDAEATMYNDIRKKYPILLGFAIPPLLSAGTLSRSVGLYGATAVIATELVGHGLHRDVNRMLWTSVPGSFRRVKSKDEREIYLAALKSLRKLHQHLIAHRDVALRNLRVEQLDAHMGKWRA